MTAMLDDFDTELLLTRKEAADYKGLSGESSLRDAESRGLACITDAEGRTLYRRRALDRWDVKGTEPTDAKKRKVLIAAQKARAHETQESARRMAAREEKAQAEHDAWLASLAANERAEEESRRRVQAKNAEREQAFRAAVMDEYAIRKLLTIDGRELRELVDMTLIREVEPPPEAKIEDMFGEPVSEYDGSRMFLIGGPFYSRADVIELYRETIGLAKERTPSGAPPELVRGIAGACLRAFVSSAAGTKAAEALSRELDKVLGEFRRRNGGR
jgi:hypothetical protein